MSSQVFNFAYQDDPEVTWQKAIASTLKPGAEVELMLTGGHRAVGMVEKCAAVHVELHDDLGEPTFVRRRSIDAFRVL